MILGIPWEKSQTGSNHVIRLANRYDRAMRSNYRETSPLKFPLNVLKSALLHHLVQTKHYFCPQVHLIWVSKKVSCNTQYRSELIVSVTLSSKKYGPKIPNSAIAHHTHTWELCKRRSFNPQGLFWNQYGKF